MRKNENVSTRIRERLLSNWEGPAELRSLINTSKSENSIHRATGFKNGTIYVQIKITGIKVEKRDIERAHPLYSKVVIIRIRKKWFFQNKYCLKI